MSKQNVLDEEQTVTVCISCLNCIPNRIIPSYPHCKGFGPNIKKTVQNHVTGKMETKFVQAAGRFKGDSDMSVGKYPSCFAMDNQGACPNFVPITTIPRKILRTLNIA